MTGNQVKLYLDTPFIDDPACPVSFCLSHAQLGESQISFLVESLKDSEIGRNWHKI